MAFFAKYKRATHQEGMTFIELTIMLMIFGVLMSVIAPGAMRWLSKTKLYKTEAMVKGLKMNITQFHSDTGQYPNTLYDLAYRPAEQKVAQRWRGPYVEERDIEQDGWGNELVYTKNAAGAGKRSYELYSWGPSGEGAPQEEWVDAWSL